MMLVLPNWRSASALSSAGDQPRATYSCARICKWNRSSSSISLSKRAFWKTPARRARTTRQPFISRAPHHAGDRSRETDPVRLLQFKLLPPLPGQAIETRALIVIRNAPFVFNPALQDKALQRRVKRAFLDCENVSRELLNALGYPVPVHLAVHQRLQNQHIESALQQFCICGAHGRRVLT